MKKIALALALSGLSACGSSKTHMSAFVVNDAKGASETAEDPAVVAIYVKNSAVYSSQGLEYVCAGTLIAPNLVLTAAQCVYYVSKEYYVLSGSDLRDPAKRLDPILARELHFDRTFDRDDLNKGHDLALLVLAKTLEDVRPIPYLKSPMTPDMRGHEARLVGYGDRSGSNPKRTMVAKLEGSDDLFVNLGGLSQPICAGDTGGPVLMQIDGVETIIGVNSLKGDACLTRSKANRVDVYAQDVIGPILETSQKPASALKPAATSCKFAVTCAENPLNGHGSEAKVQYACDAGYAKFETIGPFKWTLYPQDCERLAGALNGAVLPRAQPSAKVPLLERGLMVETYTYHAKAIKEGPRTFGAVTTAEETCGLVQTNYSVIQDQYRLPRVFENHSGLGASRKVCEDLVDIIKGLDIGTALVE